MRRGPASDCDMRLWYRSRRSTIAVPEGAMVPWLGDACLHAVKRSYQGRKLATWLAPSPIRLVRRLATQISAAALAVFCHQFGAGGLAVPEAELVWRAVSKLSHNRLNVIYAETPALLLI